MTKSSQETTVISLEGVKKTRGDFELEPVDLRIEPGQIVAVVGPNGSSKSTLFGMLMNLLKPSSGELRLFGRSYPDDEVRINSPSGRLRDGGSRPCALALDRPLRRSRIS